MNKPIVDMLQLAPAQLRVLLTFSRDLFQSDDLPSAARLVGQTLADVVHPDEALLLTGGTQPVGMGFDSDGSGYPAGTNHALYHAAMHQLSAPPGICAVSRPGDRQCLAGRAMLAVALPARAPIATLVVAWGNAQSAEVVARLGGDEFVAYTLDDEQPGVILERIRANLHAFNLMQDRPYTVSISAGVVQCDPGGAQILSHYVTLADERMYALKRRRLH